MIPWRKRLVSAEPRRPGKASRNCDASAIESPHWLMLAGAVFVLAFDLGPGEDPDPSQDW